MRYVLYVYAPDDVVSPAYQLESSEPFLMFQRGDIINPRTWPPFHSAPFGKNDANLYGLVLRVTGLEHLLYETRAGDEAVLRQHTLRVYTTAVEDVEESRS